MDIYTEIGGMIKTKCKEVFIKNRTFLIREGFLIKGHVKLIVEWRKGREMAQDVHETFL
jgi:hypothetical protein